MKELNKLEKIIFWIFLISLLVDNINGILLTNNINLSMSLGKIYRYAMIMFFAYYIIKSKNKKIIIGITISILYLILLSVCYFLNHMSINGLIMDITYAIKLIYPFIIILSLYLMKKQKMIEYDFIDKIFYCFSIVAPLTLIIPRIFNMGYSAYELGGGYKGFYYANNEINIVLVCTFIYAMDRLYNLKSLKSVVITIMNALALFFIGSKTSIIVIALIIAIYILKLRKDKKWFWGIITCTFVGIILTSVIFSEQIYQMIVRNNYFYNMLTEQGGIITFLMSERNLRIVPTFQKNIINVGTLQGIINFLFGIGRYQQVDPNILRTLIELDFFDTFYWYGILAAIIVFVTYISFFIIALKQKELFKYKLMFLIVFVFSMMAGHVWFSALSSQMLALICYVLTYKKQSSKENLWEKENTIEKISIITPYYHGKKYLKMLCDMIEKNYHNIKGIALLEFILVNDSPEEDIDVEIFKEYSFEYKIVINPKNMGIQKARVNGLEKSSGQYILFLDQDDEILPNYIFSQYTKIKNNDVIICNGKLVKNRKTQPIYHSIEEQSYAIDLGKHKYEAQIVSPGLALIKKDAIPQYWCDNVLQNLGADDYFLWILMLYNNKKFTINTDKLFCYNISNNNYSQNKERMKKSALEACDLLEKYNEGLYKEVTKTFRKMQTVNYHKNESIIQNALNLIKNIPIVFYKIHRNIVKKYYQIRYRF